MYVLLYSPTVTSPRPSGNSSEMLNSTQLQAELEQTRSTVDHLDKQVSELTDKVDSLGADVRVILDLLRKGPQADAQTGCCRSAESPGEFTGEIPLGEISPGDCYQSSQVPYGHVVQIAPPGGHGLQMSPPGGHGLQIAPPGGHRPRISPPGGHGLPISPPGGHGLLISPPGGHKGRQWIPSTTVLGSEGSLPGILKTGSGDRMLPGGHRVDFLETTSSAPPSANSFENCKTDAATAHNFVYDGEPNARTQRRASMELYEPLAPPNRRQDDSPDKSDQEQSRDSVCDSWVKPESGFCSPQNTRHDAGAGRMFPPGTVRLKDYSTSSQSSVKGDSGIDIGKDTDLPSQTTTYMSTDL